MTSTEPNLELETIANHYIAIMQTVAERLDAIGPLVDEVNANQGHPNNWQNAELCYLIIRKCIELIAIAMILVHRLYEADETLTLEDDWKADRIFTALSKLNRYSFPHPVNMIINDDGEPHNVDDEEVSISARQMKRIYDQCARHLHAGTLSDILTGALLPFDLPQIVRWRDRLIETLEEHRIILPHIGMVLLFRLREPSSGHARVLWGKAEGPFIINNDPNVYNNLETP